VEEGRRHPVLGWRGAVATVLGWRGTAAAAVLGWRGAAAAIAVLGWRGAAATTMLRWKERGERERESGGGAWRRGREWRVGGEEREWEAEGAVGRGLWGGMN
jgi:hypothetical protein